jgi:hypothetical protein
VSEQGFKMFLEAYNVALLWSSEPRPGYWGVADMSPSMSMRCEDDCRRFYDAFHVHFDGREVDAGHDFALTRNRHGAGFWEHGRWPSPAGEIMRDGAWAAGSIEIEEDDGAGLYIL